MTSRHVYACAGTITAARTPLVQTGFRTLRPIQRNSRNPTRTSGKTFDGDEARLCFASDMQLAAYYEGAI